MPRKKITEIHGKVDDGKASTLEQVWGFNEAARFGTIDREVFITQLNEMNKTDLEEFARARGIFVAEATERTRASILKEFDIFISALRPRPTKSAPLNVSDEARKILAEGR